MLLAAKDGKNFVVFDGGVHELTREAFRNAVLAQKEAGATGALSTRMAVRWQQDAQSVDDSRTRTTTMGLMSQRLVPKRQAPPPTWRF